MDTIPIIIAALLILSIALVLFIYLRKPAVRVEMGNLGNAAQRSVKDATGDVMDAALDVKVKTKDKIR